MLIYFCKPSSLITRARKMKLSGYWKLKSALFFFIVVVFFLGLSYVGVNPRAQDRTQLPARTGYVNDFAGVLDEQTKQRLAAILEKVKQKSGIELDLATVQTTGGQDIFDYSRQLANDWDIGARNSKKSLLLVVSVSEKTVFTQLSRSVQAQLPEGILGEVSLRMRAPLNSGNFNEGITEGVEHFVSALARKAGFDIQDIEHAAATASDPAAASSEAHLERARRVTEPTAPAPATAISNTREESSAKPSASSSRKASTPVDDEAEAEEVELTLTLPLEERITKLKEFLATHPSSKANPRANELLVSSHAGVGDQRLKNGDSKGGIDELMLAINEAPANISDKLFAGVISQIPLNLYLRGERMAAIEAAQKIESKFGSDPKRLIAIAGFYLGIEEGQEAARLAAEAVKLAPDSAEAHYALGLGLHIALQLDEAAAEYKRALDLDPNAKGPKSARRSLADLYRGAGKAEEALALYRQQLTAEPTDKPAKAGLVLALLDLKLTDEATKEMAATLQDDPRNLPLLTGAAYWFAAHNDFDQAQDLAGRAINIEPRYTWSQIAMARTLIGKRKPLEAERAIRFAAQYGKFPTLDYELGNVLASAGLYEEAAEVLMKSFRLKDGQIETHLAGRVFTRSPTFIELLAPERRASIFQSVPADTANNAAMLKALLAFTIASSPAAETEKLDETLAANAAKEFASGADEMRVYRQLYAASRLLRKGIALQTAYELTEAARSSVDSALDVPALTVAVQADEYRDIRASAIAQGATPDIPDAPRNVLANLLRGRIEDLAGWAMLNQTKTEAAVEHLKLAVTILPEATPSWRAASWRLASALEQSGDGKTALTYYIKSYNSSGADQARRSVIEQLYQKINGSLDGLDQQIGAGAQIAAANTRLESTVQKPVAETPSASPAPEAQAVSSAAANAALSPTPVPANSPASPEASPTATPEASPTAMPEAPTAMPEAPTAMPEASPTATPEASPTSQSSPSLTPEAPTASPEATPQASPTPTSPESLQEMAAKLRQTLKLTGRVKDANNKGIPNVVMVLISPRGTVLASTTDAEGNYSFTISPSQLSYRIIPSKDSFTFTPMDKILTSVSDDQKEIDFLGASSRSP
jgi:uncharacterized membrane protein YgcG/Flp pilus assembly protein TadD